MKLPLRPLQLHQALSDQTHPMIGIKGGPGKTLPPYQGLFNSDKGKGIRGSNFFPSTAHLAEI